MQGKRGDCCLGHKEVSWVVGLWCVRARRQPQSRYISRSMTERTCACIRRVYQTLTELFHNAGTICSHSVLPKYSSENRLPFNTGQNLVSAKEGGRGCKDTIFTVEGTSTRVSIIHCKSLLFKCFGNMPPREALTVLSKTGEFHRGCKKVSFAKKGKDSVLSCLCRDLRSKVTNLVR